MKILENRPILWAGLVIAFFTACQQQGSQNADKEYINDPVVQIACADPSLVKYEGKYYLYATEDPWGGNELVVLESGDFVNWERRHIKWPNLKDCSSPTSNDSRVWAPSVVQGKDGKFYMYVSVHSEIWAGVAETPLGEWKNAKEDNTPLIHGKFFPEYHMIDAEVFMDDDGQVYLYWGSGWNWTNGRCFVVPLADDMVTFDTEKIQDVTPPNYFEAPFMLKKDGKYHLMYSDGKCTNGTYMVRTSVGNTPYGPWEEEPESPVLRTTADSTTLGPGHHTVFEEGGAYYILYHRIRDNSKDLLRELVIDKLEFDKNGNIQRIGPNGRVYGFSENK